MATWVIREDHGTWSVRCGRIEKSFSSEDDALRFIREGRSWGDRLVLEETDGYRVPLKPRRHWRRR